jgi:hypothetical protein
MPDFGIGEALSGYFKSPAGQTFLSGGGQTAPSPGPDPGLATLTQALGGLSDPLTGGPMSGGSFTPDPVSPTLPTPPAPGIGSPPGPGFGPVPGGIPLGGGDLTALRDQQGSAGEDGP